MKTKQTKLRLRVLQKILFGKLILVFGSSMWAEEPTSRLAELEAVITTASPTGSAVVYQSSQAFNEEDLTRRAAVSLGAMLDGEPGLASRSFGGAPARPVIRGLDGERLIILENGERMGDIQQTAPDHAITLDPLGMDRVEVVRGPASLLYGSSALGGVINIFTQDFVTDWEDGWQIGLSSHFADNNNLISIGGSSVYGFGNQAVTGRVTYRKSGDGKTPNEPIQNSQIDSYTISAGYSFRTDNFLGGISVRYYDNVYGVPEFASESDPESPGFFTEVEPDLEIRIDRLNLQSKGFWTLNGAFREVEARLSLSTSLQEEGDPEDLELGIETDTISGTILARHEAFSVFDEGAIGFNLHRRYQEVDGLEAYSPGEDIWNIALFTFQEIPFSDTLRFQFGVRAEQEWLSSVGNRFFPDEDLISDTLFNVVGSIGLNWRPSENLEIGSQLARAHRNPTVLERFADGWHAGAARVELGNEDLDPEIGYGLDFFMRYRTERIFTEISAFYNRIDNFIALELLDPIEAINIPYRVRSPREFPTTVQFFGADAELYGFEIQASYLLTDELRLNMISDFVRGTRRDGDRDPLPFIPPFRVTLGASYELDRFFLSGNARMVAAQTRTPDDELPTSGYTIFRLESGYRIATTDFGIHSINVRIDNLFDRSYSDHLSVVRRFPDPVEGPSAPVRFQEPGRNINLMYTILF